MAEKPIKVNQDNIVQVPVEGDLNKAIFLDGKIVSINGHKVDIPFNFSKQ